MGKGRTFLIEMHWPCAIWRQHLLHPKFFLLLAMTTNYFNTWEFHPCIPIPSDPKKSAKPTSAWKKTIFFPYLRISSIRQQSFLIVQESSINDLVSNSIKWVSDWATFDFNSFRALQSCRRHICVVDIYVSFLTIVQKDKCSVTRVVRQMAKS